MNSKINVLLTGYSGFLGHYLGKSLMKNGFCLRVLFHRQTLTRKEVNNDDIEVIWGSIDNLDVVRKALDGVDYVVHSAWAFNSAIEGHSTINESAAKMLFGESVRLGIKKFAFISSVVVYGMSKKNSETNLLISESSPLATGKELEFLYPYEKISIEKYLQEFDRKKTALAIFRPGPIFDERRGPPKKVLKLGHRNFGVGFGNGRNHMAFIHAKDVAAAVTLWLLYGKDGSIFNVVPSECLSSKDWFHAWGKRNNLALKPIFIPGIVISLADVGLKIFKKAIGKQTKKDMKYSIACAKRDLLYSNQNLKKSLGWKDKITLEYIKIIQ
ncbi:MAG: NAD-dependent epimerase/dehydratase family protein [Promethearchaeota archaeon]